VNEAVWDPALWDTLAPIPGESVAQHTAFLDYCRMGPGRSLKKLAARYRGQREAEAGPEKPPTTRINTLKDWSVKYQWQNRLVAYHAEQAQHDQALWEERQREVRQQDWAIGDALRELAAKVLEQSPQFITTKRRLIAPPRNAKGEVIGPEREVITMSIDIDGLVKLAKLASELQRQAAEIAPPVQQHQVMSTVVSLTADDLAAAQTLVEQFEDELFGRSSAQPDDDNRL